MSGFGSPVAVYFVFEDDSLDQESHPNKLLLARPVPSVQDFCAAIRGLFYPGQVRFVTVHQKALDCSSLLLSSAPDCETPPANSIICVREIYIDDSSIMNSKEGDLTFFAGRCALLFLSFQRAAFRIRL